MLGTIGKIHISPYVIEVLTDIECVLQHIYDIYSYTIIISGPQANTSRNNLLLYHPPRLNIIVKNFLIKD